MRNKHVETLRELRALYVKARRERVADNLRFNCPGGHEKRLSDIQNAIMAIDEAIKDEEEQLQSGDAPADPERPRPEQRGVPANANGWSANGSKPHSASPLDTPIEFEWRSYDAWRSGRKIGAVRNGAGN